ncbi:hypothetical protein [Lentzea flaviverrucosa]|uniref:Uncharacterized protein n=1 Tax=Lentzea flaviverrucosa TaxID=200379 RepID=A0A1H9UZ51_9PSEU|nr:hypothetical protein [Lentzea flaviverrucosa]RDI27645.1 hypothetical protein DFR72_106129 [Lentzea flaviverrucosa]SES14696.1 hypothetical protein SAMN05216195_109216 [Lentzea flaviverrucosa]
MDTYIDLKDVRVTGYVSMGLIALVVAESIWGTINDWQGGSSSWSFLAIMLLVPAGVACMVWFRGVTHNAEAIALHGVRTVSQVWKASDPEQREVPFAQRAASPLIKPWQYAFLAMVLGDVFESLLLDTPLYVVFSTLSTLCAIGAGGLACFLVFRISIMQQRFAVPQRKRG